MVKLDPKLDGGVGRRSWIRSWMVKLDDEVGWQSWMVKLGGEVGWRSWMVKLDGEVGPVKLDFLRCLYGHF